MYGIKAVLWKNLLLSRKQWPYVLIEMIIPLLFFGILPYAKIQNAIDSRNVTSSGRLMDMDITKSYLYLSLDNESEIWYAPSTDDSDEIMDYVATELGLSFDNVLNFETREDLFREDFNKIHENAKERNKSTYIITFEKDINKHPYYNISLNKNYLEWKTQGLHRIGPNKNSYYNPYLHEGFLALQILIGKAIIQAVVEDFNVKNIPITLEELRVTPKKYFEETKEFIIFTLPLFLLFCFGVPIILDVRRQFWHEERSGLNDLMRVSSVSINTVLLGCFIHKTILLLVPIIAITIAMRYSLMPNCNLGVLFLFVLLYSMAAVSNYLFLVCASKKSFILFLSWFLLWFISYFLPNVENWSFFWKIVSSICFSNIALKFGCIALTKLEITEMSLGLANLSSSSFEKGQDELNMTIIFIILMGNIIFGYSSSLLADYLYKINGQLILTVIIRKFRKIFRNSSISNDNDCQLSTYNNKEICIADLVKKFETNTVLKVPRLDLDQRKITAILGMNGAGKSTLISILTGKINSYSGTIKFNNSDGKYRKIGFCPQRNVYFEDLTVEENLLFFAKLSGAKCPFGEANDILEELDLIGKRDAKVCTLSIDHKRQLCLGMALVGHPNILIVDEPTAGVTEESSQRTIRNVLRKRAGDTTVLITTHNFKEAENVADKVLFLDKGEVLLPATPVTNLKKDKEYVITLLISDLSRLAEFKRYITINFPNLRILHRAGERIVFRPLKNEIECQQCIEQLNKFKNELSIKRISYNVNILENMFMSKLNERNGEQNGGRTRSLSKNKSDYLPKLSAKRNYGYETSIFMKKLFNKKLYWYLPGLLIVALFIIFAIISTSESRSYYNNNITYPVNLDANLYENTKVFFSKIENIDSKKINQINSKVVQVIYEEIKNGSLLPEQTNIIGADFQKDKNNSEILGVNIVYSSSFLHSAPVAVNFAMNTILQILSNVSNPNAIKTYNAPLTNGYSSYILEGSTKNGISLGLIGISFGILMWSANYVIFAHIRMQVPQLETTSFSKMLRYWNFHLLFDSSIAIIQILIILLYTFLLDHILLSTTILSGQEYGILSVVVLFYVISQLPFCYVCAFSKDITKAYATFILFGIGFGILPVLPWTIGLTDQSKYVGLKSVSYILFPQFALSYNLHNVEKKFMDNNNWDIMNPLEKQVICRNVTANPCCSANSKECYQHRSYFNNDQFGIKYNLLYSIITLILWEVLLIVFIYGKKNFKNAKWFSKTTASEPSIELSNVHNSTALFDEKTSATKYPQSTYQQ